MFRGEPAVAREVPTPTPLVREAIGATWALRARGEREAEARFARLARALGRTGAPGEVQGLALRASVDESRHVSLCSRLARSYGARIETASPLVPTADTTGLEPEDAALAEVVALCCIAETISVAAFGAILESAEPREIRDVAESILHDEAFHAEIGWTHLAAELAHGRGAFLGEVLPSLLASNLSAELGLASSALGDGVEADEARSFGLLPAARQRAIVRDALGSVVLPKLEAAGVETAAAVAWLASVQDPPSR
jgi:hypothetical protein